MQGIVINTNPGSNTSQRANAKGLIVPVMTGLEGMFIHEDTVALCAKNWAPGKVDAVSVGAPTMGAANKGVLLTNVVNYLQTSIAESDNMTIISVQENSALRGYGVSNYPSTRVGVSGTSNGVGIQLTTSGGNQVAALFDSQFSGVAAAASNLATPASYSLAAGGNRALALRTIEPAGTVVANDLTGAVQRSVTRSGSGIGTARDKGQGLLRLGSAYAADAGDPIRYFMHLIYSVTLSDAQLAQMYAWIKAYWARRAITV